MTDGGKRTATFPQIRKQDGEDVTWALSTSEAMWARGDHIEAIKWIRRAAEAASELGDDERALELAKAAAELAASLQEGIPPTKIQGAPTPPAKKDSKSTPPKAPVASGSTRPGWLSSAQKSARPASPVKATVKSPSALPAASRVPTASLPVRTPPPAVRGTSHGRGNAQPTSVRLEAAAPLSSPLSRRDEDPSPTVVQARPQSREDAEAWPTQTLSAEELQALENERQASRDATPRDANARVQQAFTVTLTRTPTGELVVAVATPPVASDAVTAVLVALEPGTDLASLLGVR